MDWNLAIEKNTHALAVVVSGLWKLVNMHNEPPSSRLPCKPGSTTPQNGHQVSDVTHKWIPARSSGRDDVELYIGPITRRILVRTLRTVEAALRRLILLYVYVHGVKTIARRRQDKRDRPLPDFSKFGSGSNDRPPVFKLFDPRKPLSLVLREAQGEEINLSSTNLSNTSSPDLSTPSSSDLIRGSMPEPRILFPLSQSFGLCVDGRIKSDHDELRWTEDDGIFAGEDNVENYPPSVAKQALCENAALPVNGREPDGEAENKQSAGKIIRRLKALDHALKTIHQQAKRLVRIMAKRELVPPGPRKVGPIRPGIPPGFNKSSNEPPHEVLRELHGLVRDWEKDAWERRCERNAEP